MITELHLFDFDGTLFNSPEDTPENRQKFEALTGMPWTINKDKAKELSEKLGRYVGTRSGWWGRKETLQPPLVPEPTPLDMFNKKVVSSFNKSKENKNAVTLLLTGRLLHLKTQIKKICNAAELLDDRVFFYVMGENGPKPTGKKPTNTFDWKIWIVEQFLEIHDKIETLTVWEDREEHVKKFEALRDKIANNLIVHHIKG